MPRLSLFKPEKGNDYKFIDRQIAEMFAIGGTDLYLHKYIGVNTSAENATADQPHYDTLKETNIQDLLFLENRDRKYDSSIYSVRGIYNVQNLDFNLSQFGLFIDNDTIFCNIYKTNAATLIATLARNLNHLNFKNPYDNSQEAFSWDIERVGQTLFGTRGGSYTFITNYFNSDGASVKIVEPWILDKRSGK